MSHFFLFMLKLWETYFLIICHSWCKVCAKILCSLRDVVSVRWSVRSSVGHTRVEFLRNPPNLNKKASEMKKRMLFKRRFKDKYANSSPERICCPNSVRLVLSIIIEKFKWNGESVFVEKKGFHLLMRRDLGKKRTFFCWNFFFSKSLFLFLFPRSSILSLSFVFYSSCKFFFLDATALRPSVGPFVGLLVRRSVLCYFRKTNMAVFVGKKSSKYIINNDMMSSRICCTPAVLVQIIIQMKVVFFFQACIFSTFFPIFSLQSVIHIQHHGPIISHFAPIHSYS